MRGRRIREKGEREEGRRWIEGGSVCLYGRGCKCVCGVVICCKCVSVFVKDGWDKCVCMYMERGP